MAYTDKFDAELFKEAMLYVDRANAYVERIKTDISDIDSLSANVKVPNLNISETVLVGNEVDRVIGLPPIMALMNESALLVLMDRPDFMDQIATWISNKMLPMRKALDIGKTYMKFLIGKYGNDYMSKLNLKEVGNPSEALKEAGMPEEILDNLNASFCASLAEKDLMYSGEGVAYMAYSFTGIMAMYGLALDYDLGSSFDSSSGNTLYLGDSNKSLGYLDCNNYYDWLCRCVGVDSWAGRAKTKYNYAVDGITPDSQINASYGDEYFTNAKAGDIMANNEHIVIILENDGEGYYIAEEAGCAKIQYMTYEELASYDYKVTNMDGHFNNTSDYGKSAGRYGEDHHYYIPAEEFANQIPNLEPEVIDKINSQYNKRNKLIAPGMVELTVE